MQQIVKRTFEAKKYPKGSEERIKLNESAITSEYMPSYKYCIVDEQGKTNGRSYTSKADAEKALSRLQ
jgi:hypothetical protein